jgi:hypothetical protein
LRGEGIEVFVVILLEDLEEEGVFELMSAREAPVGFGEGADEVLFGLVGGSVGLAVAFEVGIEGGFLAGAAVAGMPGIRAILPGRRAFGR